MGPPWCWEITFYLRRNMHYRREDDAKVAMSFPLSLSLFSLCLTTITNTTTSAFHCHTVVSQPCDFKHTSLKTSFEIRRQSVPNTRCDFCNFQRPTNLSPLSLFSYLIRYKLSVMETGRVDRLRLPVGSGRVRCFGQMSASEQSFCPRISAAKDL